MNQVHVMMAHPIDTPDNRRILTISVGAGRRVPTSQRRSGLSIADLLNGLGSVVDSWWSPHVWTDDRRKQDGWQSADSIAVDLDYHSESGGKATPSDADAQRFVALAQSGRLPGTCWHPTPHGARVIFELAESVRDGVLYGRLARGAEVLLGRVLAEHDLISYNVDPVVTQDLARLLFAPKAKVDGHQRDAVVLQIGEGRTCPLDGELFDLGDERPVDQGAQEGRPVVFDRAGPWASRAFDAEVTRVLRSIEGERNSTLNRAAFALGQIVGGGSLDEQQVKQALVRAGLACGLPEGEVRATVDHGLHDGQKQPRKPPERKNWRVLEGESAPPTIDAPPLTDADAPPGFEPAAPKVETPKPEDGKAKVIPFTVGARAFLGDDEPEEDDASEWVIKGMVPRAAVTFLAGSPKSMKTWIGLLSGLCVASGRALFGKQQVTEGMVLVFCEEDSERRIRQRVWWLARGLGLDPRDLDPFLRFSVMKGSRLDDPACVAKIQAELKAYNPAMVLIDALSRVHAADENDRTAMRSVTTTLQTLTMQSGAAFLIIHHFRKPSGDDDSKQRAGIRMRGTGDLFALARSVIGVDRSDEGPITVSASGNYGEVEPFTVELKEGTNPFGKKTVRIEHGGSPEEAMERGAMNRITSFLRESGEPATISDVARGAKVRKEDVGPVLRRMETEGIVRTVPVRRAAGNGGSRSYPGFALVSTHTKYEVRSGD